MAAYTMERPLNIDVYNSREREAYQYLSNDHIRAFSPVTFWAEAYPSVVENEQEILRYVDTMHEMNEPIRHHEMDLYSPDEAALITKICDRVSEMNRFWFHKPVRPWMGPLGQMKVFRAVQ